MTKITEELIGAIAEAVRRDMPNIEACALFRITETTFYRWKQKGEKDIENGIESLEGVFCEAIKKAESEAVDEGLAMIRAASQEGKNWQARAWILERCYRKRFAQNADQFEKLEKQILDLANRIEKRSDKIAGVREYGSNEKDEEEVEESKVRRPKRIGKTKVEEKGK